MKKLLLLLVSFMSFGSFAAKVDVEKSVFQWTGSKITESHTGKISLKEGNVELGENSKLEGGELVMDMRSITVEDISGKNATKFLNHMKSDDFFKVEKHPTSTLKIKNVKGKTVTADLTILGKTKEVRFPYEVKNNVFSGKLTFDRTKFGIKYGSGSFFDNLGDKMIKDEVVVDFKVPVL